MQFRGRPEDHSHCILDCEIDGLSVTECDGAVTERKQVRCGSGVTRLGSERPD
jgi:hypothetical protein